MVHPQRVTRSSCRRIHWSLVGSSPRKRILEDSLSAPREEFYFTPLVSLDIIDDLSLHDVKSYATKLSITTKSLSREVHGRRQW